MKGGRRVMLCGLLILALLCSSILVSEVQAPITYLSVEPYYVQIGGPDTTFSLNISAMYVSNLYAWELKLQYDNSILSCIGVTEGPFLRTGHDTFFILNITDNFDATHGQVHMACSILGDVPGVSGSGVIATLTFNTRQVGASYVEMQDTRLSDPYAGPITHLHYDGYVEVVQIERNVAVTNVRPEATEAFSGQPVTIYVDVVNLGKKTETFNVTTYSNETVIATQTVTNLLQGSNTTLTFQWDTGGTSAGEDYVIKAVAQALAGETNLADNTFVDGSVRILYGIHDVAVDDVTVPVSEVHEGQEVDVSVSVRNKGNYTETFNVSAYFGGTLISSQTVSGLAPGSARLLTFAWNTTGFPLSMTQPVIANASSVQGEANLADNVLSGDTVTILPHVGPSITILEVVPCDQFGQPVSYFKTGGLAYFNVTISAIVEQPQQVLVTVNVFDGDQTLIGLVCIHGPIVAGKSFFISGLPVPLTARLGTASVYANIFNDWPHTPGGGIPYCPQVSRSFEIRGVT